MDFPCGRRVKLHSTNPLIRLVGAIMLEQEDEWAVQRLGYMTLETSAPVRDDSRLSLAAASSAEPAGEARYDLPLLHHSLGHALYVNARRTTQGNSHEQEHDLHLV